MNRFLRNILIPSRTDREQSYCSIMEGILLLHDMDMLY